MARFQGTACDIGAYEFDTSGSLTIVKTVVNDDGGTLSSSDFTINVSGNNPSQTSFAGSESGVVVTLEAGAYSITEDPVAGYSGSFSADCSGDIAAGENKTCTVTNDDIAPTITVTKVVVPASDTGVFSLTIDDVSHAEGGDGTSTGAIAVSVGTRSIGETGASGTDLADYDRVIGGDCAADGTITVALADNASCTLTNTRRGTITVKKAVSNAADAPSGVDFAFASDALGAFSLQDQGEQVFSQLPANSSYSLSETLPPHWTLTDVSCSSTGSSVLTPIENGQSIELAPADDVICTFSNTFDDGDGIEPAQEDGVPGYNGSAQGDGNGDGIADKLQANVSSVQNGSCWWTLESDGLQHREVMPVGVPADVSSLLVYPCDFLDFAVELAPAQSELHVTLYFSPRNLSLVGVVKYNHLTQRWDVLGTVDHSGDKTIVRYSLSDGGPYDDDRAVDGQIQDPVGAAALAIGEGGESRPTPIPSLTPFGLGVLVAAWALLLIIMRRRSGVMK